MEKVRVVLFGIGAIGSLVAKLLLEKEGVEIVGTVDIDENKVGKDLGEVLGIEKKLGIQVSRDINALFSKVKADITIHATSSFLKDTYPQIASIIKHDTKVISTCEELVYPYYAEPKLAKQLNKLAKKHKATVLGTGINPGFIMDILVITLTAVCQKIEKIEAVRIINAAKRRLPFQKKIGLGLTVEEFKQKINCGRITGHVGLEQSIAMVVDTLAWKLDKITVDPIKPIIAEKAVESEYVKVKAGHVRGLKQRAKGIINDGEVIVLDFQACIGAEEEYDAITIHGLPNVKQKIQPSVNGDVGTASIIVNLIPKVIKAPPSLFTMKDLPVPSATIGDLRKYI